MVIVIQKYVIDLNARLNPDIKPLKGNNKMSTTKNGKPTNPLLMLKEIEAYLTFRLISDNPTIPPEDMQMLKDDLNECLLANGCDVNYNGV